MDLTFSAMRRHGGGFPRRRGDGPVLGHVRPYRETFPPQARGWTFVSMSHADSRPVSPAGAGMDRAEDAWEGFSRGFPRRRGDGPFLTPAEGSSTGFPPQARGWTSLPGSGRYVYSVSPAGAGMDLEKAGEASPDIGFPRRRGDGPGQFTPEEVLQEFPPQARGWTGGEPAMGFRAARSRTPAPGSASGPWPTPTASRAPAPCSNPKAPSGPVIRNNPLQPDPRPPRGGTAPPVRPFDKLFPSPPHPLTAQSRPGGRPRRPRCCGTPSPGRLWRARKKPAPPRNHSFEPPSCSR